MHLENFTFATQRLVRVDRAETSAEVIQLLIKYLNEGGTIGETGWTVAVKPRQQHGGFEFIMDRDGLGVMKAFLAGTDAISAAVWQKACAEAAEVGQQHPGCARRKLKTPWVTSIGMGDIHAGPRSVRTEAAGLQIYVAFALLDQFGFDGGLHEVR